MKRLLSSALGLTALLLAAAPVFAMSGVSTTQLQAVVCDISAVTTVAESVEGAAGATGTKVATRTTTIQAASADLCNQIGGVVAAAVPMPPAK